MFRGPFEYSIIARAVREGRLEIHIHNIRDYATDRHKVTDDYPYGGGPGMVMKPEPIFAAVEAVMGDERGPEAPVILMTPSGRLLKQSIVRELAKKRRIGIICGHYEGVDERVRLYLATEELSIGDYVLTGGELPAMVLVDAVARLLPGVISSESVAEESFSDGLLEYPQYTRPANFRGWKVPEILLSGNHAQIARWRRGWALIRTLDRRPDLLSWDDLTEEDRQLVEWVRSLGL
jgi:tRNA (guanine37-N1)-methyltransferase